MDLRNFRISANTPLPYRMAALDTGVSIRVPITATFENDDLRITVITDVANGTPICRAYSVERVPEGLGLELATTEIMRGISLRDLMAVACQMAAIEPIEGEPGRFLLSGLQSSEAVRTSIVRSARRKNQPITDETLSAFAAAYRERYVRGRMDEFAQSLNYSERHAWHLKKLATARGFLPAKGEKS